MAVPIKRRGRVRRHDGGWCHRAQRHAGGGAGARSIERDADPRTHHRDIHLVARNEAQVGIDEPGPGAGISNDTRNSPAASTLLPGPVQKSSTATRVRRPARRSGTRHPTAISAGTVSAAGDEWHRLPPTLARLWICDEPDQFGRLHQAGIGLAQRRMVGQVDRGHRRAEHQTIGGKRNLSDLSDVLDIDDQFGNVASQPASAP